MAAPKRGRPSKCSQSIADSIMDGLSQGDSLSQVCKDLDLPYSTVFGWMDKYQDTFFVNSPRAYKAGYDKIADDCIDISDESGADVSVDDKGKYTVDGEVIQRARLRIDTRLRLLGKWSNKYADRSINENLNKNLNADATIDELSTTELTKIATSK